MAKSLLKGIITAAAVVATGGGALVAFGLGALSAGMDQYGRAQRRKYLLKATGLQPLTVQQALSIAPAASIYGSKAIGGAIVMIDQSEFSNWEAHGGQGRGKTVFTLHQLTALAYRPGGVEGIEGFFLNEKWYPISKLRRSTFPLTGPTVYDLTGGRTGFNPNALDYGAQVRADTKGSNEHPAFYPVAFEMGLGDGVTSGLYSARPQELSDKSRNFPNTALGTDVCWIHAMFRLVDGFLSGDEEVGGSEMLFQSGAPRITTVVKGNKVYDPRESGQSVDDPSTWTWSDTPALCVADYLTNHFNTGAIMTTQDWDSVKWAADFENEMLEAPASLNKSVEYSGTVPMGDEEPDEDQQYNAPGGNVMEERYRCDAALALAGSSHAQNLSVLLSSSRGLLTHQGGKFVQVPANYQQPVLALTPDWLLAPIGYQSNDDLQDLVTEAQADYQSRYHLWEEVLTPRLKEPDLERRTGGPINETLALAGVSRGTQAQRLAWRELQEQRGQERISIQCVYAASDLRMHDRFTLEDPVLFPVPKVFRVEQISIGGRFPVSIQAVEDSPTYWQDLTAAQYGREPSVGVIRLGVVRPPRPFNFRAEVDLDANRIVWRWDVGTAPYDDVRLWTSATPNFADATITEGLGNVREFAQDLPTGGTRYGWIGSIKDGLSSLRNPDDDVSAVSATIASRALELTGPNAEGAYPDESLGANGQRFRSTVSGQVFEKILPAPSPFDIASPIGRRAGVAARWSTPTSDGKGVLLPAWTLADGKVDTLEALTVSAQGAVSLTAANDEFTDEQLRTRLVRPYGQGAPIGREIGEALFGNPQSAGTAAQANATRLQASLRSQTTPKAIPAAWMQSGSAGEFRRVSLHLSTDAEAGLAGKWAVRFNAPGNRSAFVRLSATGVANFRLQLWHPALGYVTLSTADATRGSDNTYSADLSAAQLAWLNGAINSNLTYLGLIGGAHPWVLFNVTATIYDHAQNANRNVRFSPVLEGTYALAVRRGAAGSITGALPASATGAYALTFPSDEWAAVAAETGDYEWALVDPAVIQAATRPPLMRTWTLRGLDGVIGFSRADGWRGAAPNWIPGGTDPETIRLTGKWELDGQVVAKVSADFNLDGSTSMVSSTVNRLSPGVVVDPGNETSAANTLRERFFYEGVPLTLAASRFLTQQRPVETDDEADDEALGDVEVVTANSVTSVSFTPPATPPDEYEARYRPGPLGDGDDDWSDGGRTAHVPGASFVQVQLPPLDADTNYAVEVRPIYGVRRGSSVRVAHGTENVADETGTAPPPAPTPTEAPAVPAQPTVSRITANSAAVNWTAVPTAASYDVRWTPTGGGNFTESTVLTQHELRQLVHNTRYSVIVRARNAAGVSAWSTARIFTTVRIYAPGAPRNVEASAIGKNSIIFSWDAPTVDATHGVAAQYEHQLRVGTGAWSDPLLTTSRTATYTRPVQDDGAQLPGAGQKRHRRRPLRRGQRDDPGRRAQRARHAPLHPAGDRAAHLLGRLRGGRHARRSRGLRPALAHLRHERLDHAVEPHRAAIRRGAHRLPNGGRAA